MKFCWITINVRSMKDSLNFYENIVGLKLQNRYKNEHEPEIAFLGEGETKIELICNDKAEYESINDNISVGFQVDNLEKMMEFVKEKGVKLESPILQPNPFVRFFFVKDPNGLRVQFVESN